MLALTFFVDYFWHYLLGREFICRADHSALQWLRTLKNPQGQVIRWLKKLSEYDIQVQHRPGKGHDNARSM